MTMMFHEAIRLGAMMSEQAFGKAFTRDGKTCANGAAMLAVGHNDCEAMAGIFPFSYQTYPERCPECKVQITHFTPTIGGLAAHLNDVHRWSRERIADVIQPLEEAYEKEKQNERSESNEREAVGCSQD